MNTGGGALGDLERAAAAGQVGAQAALGERLLEAAPERQGEALHWLQTAAAAGHGDAARLLARAIVRDVTDRDHWRIALGWLARAAALGSIPAQIELGFLAGRGGEILEAVAAGQTLPPTLWERLYGAVDVAAWTAAAPGPGQVRTVATSPHVQVIEGFAEADVCDWIVHWARQRLTPSTSYDHGQARSVANHYTASPELDFVVTAIVHRVAALTGTPASGREGTSVLRYQPGQIFEPHYDFLDPRVPDLAAKLAQEGQRDMTFLLSLSDDFEGGETDFPRAPYRYKGRKGDAVLWRNVTSAGLPDYEALHAGLPPTRGEKWAFVRVCSRGPGRAAAVG